MKKINFFFTAALWAAVFVASFCLKEAVYGLCEAGIKAIPGRLAAAYGVATRVDNLTMAMVAGLVINLLRGIPARLRSLRRPR